MMLELKNYVKGSFLIAGVGNELKEFDKIGVEIVRKGREIYPEKFIDCGTTPENYLDKIIDKKIGTLIIVDAAYFKDSEKVRIIQPEELAIQGISTHSLSLKFIADYLNNYGIRTIIIGIKPGVGIEEVQKEVLSSLLELIEDEKIYSKR